MDNWTHWAMLLLSTALFMLGSRELAAIEQNQAPEHEYFLWFTLTTIGMCLFVNSSLTLYYRCEEEIKCFHTNIV